MVAKDQHQPDNSRAIAVVAIVCRFLRAVITCHRRFNRRLPASARATTAAGASFQRCCRVLPGR